MTILRLIFALGCAQLSLTAWGESAAQEPFSTIPTSTTNRARIVAVHDAQATTAFKPNSQRIVRMLNTAITNLTRTASPADAWRALANTNEVIGLKVYSSPGADVGTRPDVVAAVIQGLLDAGFATNHIVVWDRYGAHLRQSGYAELQSRFGIRVEGAVESDFDPTTYYETALIGNLVYGDLEFGSKDDAAGRKSFISKLVTKDMTKIINITPLLNHNGAGVTGNLFSLALGSADNIIRFESSRGRLATAVPELYALPILGDRVILNITDALLAQYQGEEHSMLHYTVPVNELRLSLDPVALDVMSAKELERLRQSRGNAVIPVNWDLYKNAELVQLGVADQRHIDVEKIAP